MSYTYCPLCHARQSAATAVVVSPREKSKWGLDTFDRCEG